MSRIESVINGYDNHTVNREPFFAQDESFFAIMINGEVTFYENFVKTNQKLGGKLGGFSVSPGDKDANE